MKYLLHVLVILCLGCSTVSFAQENNWVNTKNLDRYFNALEKHNKFMGTVMVYRNGEKFYTKSVGYATIEDNIPNKRNTVYRIGSISKTVTATLVFKAIEEGKLKLSDKLNTWFPSVPNAKSITIQQLLNHHSGIANFTNDPNYKTYMTTAKTEKELVAIIAKGGSDFTPGSKAEYSNSNYVLLSYILEHTYNQSFKTIVEEKISKPLQLEQLRFANGEDIKTITTASYTFAGNWKKAPLTAPSIPMGAGGIVTNADNLAQFGVALFNHKIINEKSLATMETLTDEYGSGLFKFPFNDKYAYGHMGSIDGYRSTLGYFPEENLCFVILANGLNYDSNEITIALLSAMFNKPFEIPNFETTEISAETLQQYVGIYTTPQLPLDITFTISGTTLMGQGTGQPAFPLEYKGDHTFTNNMAGIKIIFNPDNNTMILEQGGGTFTFTQK
ncbi:serine hydrolase domain-containing protein [Neptunitalea lumnitzerae]|uniref:D-Ala-D-Ala carboxypeptidase n=1 Tax=Neptunitalea lumnitzerae TaxID=2965509 RepID=A0ABQ5MG34_9FLAO|nr:serine hydrolase domain-containing protein [Neptunitalea sp. Y10]GLB47862.1 D-Ala-D-Ala carboxypeptidase [Neptunitalea sp. Y10]